MARMDRSDHDLRAAVQRFVRAFGLLDAERTPCGHPLIPSDAHALMVLREADGEGMPQAALARELGLDKSSVSRLVARLEARGHLDAPGSAEVAARDGDRRVRRVALSAKGRRIAEEIDGASRRRFRRLIEQFPRGERAAVIAMIERLADAVGRINEEEP